MSGSRQPQTLQGQGRALPVWKGPLSGSRQPRTQQGQGRALPPLKKSSTSRHGLESSQCSPACCNNKLQRSVAVANPRLGRGRGERYQLSNPWQSPTPDLAGAGASATIMHTKGGVTYLQTPAELSRLLLHWLAWAKMEMHFIFLSLYIHVVF